MAIWRSPELESIFGGPLDRSGITEASVSGVIADGAIESDVLDFKEVLWPKSTSSVGWRTEQEFAKDVASFANHRGGVLLVGVIDTAGVATAASPLPAGTDPEVEQRRLRQALVNHMAPVAMCEFVWVETSMNEWFCAIVVPRSPRSPHAVLIDHGQGLKYPIRHGQDTIWMSEHEVAERYRARMAGLAVFEERVGSVVRAGARALRDTTGLWTYVAVVPEAPVEGRLDTKTVNEIDAWQARAGISSPLQRSVGADGRGIPAPGKVVFTERRFGVGDEVQVRSGYVELHADGSVYAAKAHLPGDFADRQIGELTLADDSLVLVDLGLSWTSYRAGAWGSASLRLGLLEDGRAHLASPVELVRSGGSSSSRGTRRADGDVSSEITVDLAAVTTVQQRLAVLHAALSGVLQWFGLAEPAQFKPDGTIVPAAYREYRNVANWASQMGVAAELLPGDR